MPKDLEGLRVMHEFFEKDQARKERLKKLRKNQENKAEFNAIERKMDGLSKEKIKKLKESHLVYNTMLEKTISVDVARRFVALACDRIFDSVGDKPDEGFLLEAQNVYVDVLAKRATDPKYKALARSKEFKELAELIGKPVPVDPEEAKSDSKKFHAALVGLGVSGLTLGGAAIAGAGSAAAVHAITKKTTKAVRESYYGQQPILNAAKRKHAAAH